MHYVRNYRVVEVSMGNRMCYIIVNSYVTWCYRIVYLDFMQVMRDLVRLLYHAGPGKYQEEVYIYIYSPIQPYSIHHPLVTALPPPNFQPPHKQALANPPARSKGRGRVREMGGTIIVRCSTVHFVCDVSWLVHAPLCGKTRPKCKHTYIISQYTRGILDKLR